ncbi:MAG: heme-binding protein [Lachnospiraceae bacterium]|nr:heme-binding protein [Lachnospiraceae bacterium]
MKKERVYVEEGWLDVLKEQEKILRYETFDRETILELGLKIIQTAKKNLNRNVACRIVEDTTVVFAYKGEGTTLENDWWMDRKLATTRLTGMSSLHAAVAEAYGQIEPFYEGREDNFALCGGCIPVQMKDGRKPYAFVLVSALAHNDDHQVIADAMAEQLGVEIPRIEKSI